MTTKFTINSVDVIRLTENLRAMQATQTGVTFPVKQLRVNRKWCDCQHCQKVTQPLAAGTQFIVPYHITRTKLKTWLGHDCQPRGVRHNETD